MSTNPGESFPTSFSLRTSSKFVMRGNSEPTWKKKHEIAPTVESLNVLKSSKWSFYSNLSSLTTSLQYWGRTSIESFSVEVVEDRRGLPPAEMNVAKPLIILAVLIKFQYQWEIDIWEEDVSGGMEAEIASHQLLHESTKWLTWFWVDLSKKWKFPSHKSHAMHTRSICIFI